MIEGQYQKECEVIVKRIEEYHNPSPNITMSGISGMGNLIGGFVSILIAVAVGSVVISHMSKTLNELN